MVTDGSVKFGQDIANIYLKHQYIDQDNLNESKNNAAGQNGLYGFVNYYTLTGTLNRQVLNYSRSSISLGNYTRSVTSYAFTPVTMDSLKQDTYNMILDGLCDSNNTRELLMGGKYAAVTGMDQQLDLIMIGDGDLNTYGGTVFGKEPYAIPTVDTAKLQGQLTELQKLKSKQSAALTVATQALKTAQDKFAQANNVLKKTKEQLATAKQEVATKQQDLTAAKNRLEVAQNALVAAQKIANGQAVKNAESRLAQAKKKQQVAQENQQVAHEQVNKRKAELKTANDKYTKLKEDRSLTYQKLLNAQEQLTKTGTINYIDPDGKVVKTDQVSGKVGDKVDVKISLPDGYELANKDEQIPSSITVGEDGISPISVNIKKINTTPTTPVNPTEPNNPTNPAQPSNPTTPVAPENNGQSSQSNTANNAANTNTNNQVTANHDQIAASAAPVATSVSTTPSTATKQSNLNNGQLPQTGNQSVKGTIALGIAGIMSLAMLTMFSFGNRRRKN